jgi:hypothetical protein
MAPGVGQFFYQRPVIGQKQHPFTIAVQPSSRIDARHVDELFERGMPRAVVVGELRKHAVRFIEDNGSHLRVRGYNSSNQTEEPAMTKKIIDRKNGKYKITRKDNSSKSIELELKTNNPDDYIVEELDGTDMKLPASNPIGIHWFASFSVKNKDGTYASVEYSFPFNLAKGHRIFVAYPDSNGVITAYEMTDKIKDGKITLNQGDPAVGGVPSGI